MDETVILREIQFAQSRLESDARLDYFFLIAVASLPVSPDVGGLSLPLDFERLVSYKEPLFVTSDNVFAPLPRVYEEPLLVSVGLSSGVPLGFSIRNSILQLYPASSVAATVRLPYIRRDLTLDASLVRENGWTKNAFAVLMSRAGIALAQALQSETLGSFVSDYNTAYQELVVQTTAKEDALFNLARGDYAAD